MKFSFYTKIAKDKIKAFEKANIAVVDQPANLGKTIFDLMNKKK
jgi:succinyl-CoA synthetase alpha subunit